MAIVTVCPKCAAALQVSDDRSDPTELFCCPKCQATFPLHEALDMKAEAPAEARPLKSSTDKAVSSPFSVAPADPAPKAAIRRGETPPTAAVHDPYEYEAPSHRHGAKSSPGPSAASAARRRSSSGGSFFWQMFGVIGGGVGGLYAGAYVLNYFGIPLPDVAENLPGLGPKPAAPVAQARPEDNPPAMPSPLGVPPTTPPVGQASIDYPTNRTPEPAPSLPTLETPTPAQPTPTTPVVRPLPVKGVKSFTPAELGAALGEAHRAATAPAGKGTTVAMVDDSLYEKMCALGERTSLVMADSTDKTLESRRSATRDLLRKLGAAPGNLTLIGGLARQRMQSGPHGAGVFAAGVVQSIEQEGKLIAAQLQLSGRADSIMLSSTIRQGLQVGGNFLILGTIVDEPRVNLYDYEGVQTRVVWIGMVVPVK